MLKTIIKRSGEQVPFDASKIRGAIFKANVRNATEKMSDKQLDQLTQAVVAELEKMKEVPTVEQIQDVVEEKLIAADYAKTAKAYILYRAEHQKLREMDDELVKIYSALTFVAAEDVDLKRENANINADTAMGTMLKYGSEGAKIFCDKYSSRPTCGHRPHQRENPHPRQGLLHPHRDLLPDRPAEAVQQRFLHRSRLSAGAQRHLQLFRPGLHCHPGQPKRNARRPSGAQLRLRHGSRAWIKPTRKEYFKALVQYLTEIGSLEYGQVTGPGQTT